MSPLAADDYDYIIDNDHRDFPMTNSADETPDPTTPSPEEPIDAVFEPADEGEGPGGERPKDKPGGVGYAALFTASAVAAIAGGAFGVIGSGASGVDSSKFAPAETIQQIRELQSDKNALTLQVGELETRLAELKASDEGEAERVQAALDARADGEQSLRLRLEDLLTQLDSLPRNLDQPFCASSDIFHHQSYRITSQTISTYVHSPRARVVVPIVRKRLAC